MLLSLQKKNSLGSAEKDDGKNYMKNTILGLPDDNENRLGFGSML